MSCLQAWGAISLGKAYYRELTRWLEAVALQTTRSVVLAQSLIEELRNRRVVLPSVAVIERICAEAATPPFTSLMAAATSGGSNPAITAARVRALMAAK